MGWDFGAHFGIATVGMAMQMGERGQVAAFEPDPGAFRRLAYHVRINKLTNVRLFQAAVSAGGTGKLITTHGLGSSMSHFQYEDEPLSTDSQTIKVETLAPDELVRKGEIRLPDVIKVDVQGHGAKALTGSIESIKARRPVIIYSNHSQWELAGTRSLLEQLGYRVESLAGQRVAWEFLNQESGLLLSEKINHNSISNNLCES